MPTILPDPAHLRLDHIRLDADVITLVIAGKENRAPCPLCGHHGERVHSHYRRTLADLPWNGVAVCLHLTVRRFVCEAEDCPRRIFAERFPTLAVPYARRTNRLAAILELVGFALGGEAGARVLAALTMGASPDTLLWVIRHAALPVHETPRVLGVDDFAFRRGKTYGTLLVDLERRCPVDLLPDRTAETLRQWLLAHPGVEIVSRDRGGAYADAARRGAPDAIQVADRFHLLRNLHDAVERLVVRHRSALQVKRAETETDISEPESVPREMTRKEQEKEDRRARRLERYEQVMALYRRGTSIQGIMRETGLARRTIRTFIHADGFPERAPRAARPGILTPYEPYLQERLAAGCQNGRELWHELQERGYTGSASPIYAWLTKHRTEPARIGRPRMGRQPTRWGERETVSPRQGAWLLQRQEADLHAEEQEQLHQLCAADDTLAAAHQLVQEFCRLVRERDHGAFAAWLQAVRESSIAELESFATGLCQDRAAVEAALTSAVSNGPVEGHVNKIKTIKRGMYGRANFDLLRQRVLHAG